MAIAARTEQFTQLLNRFLALDAEQFFASAPPYSDFDGPSVPEVSSMLQAIRSIYSPLISSGELSLLSHNAVTNLQSQLQNVVNTYDQVLRSRDQGNYQGFAQQLDAFFHHTRMFGVPYLAAGGAQLEVTRNALQVELDAAKKSNEDLEALKKSVRMLITPAIAGSLSQAFTQRRNTLVVGRFAWLAVCVGLGAFATYATFDLVSTLTATLKPTAANAMELSFWAIAALRTLILVPIFAAFGFGFSQYRKERDFEEEYAHKAAVANSLPNYGDLAREPAVRDQIVTAATGVIFGSPTEQAKKIQNSSAMLDGMKEVIDALTKAVGRK